MKINNESLKLVNLIQTFEISSYRLNLEAIRPWLLMVNDPAGTFKLSLKDGANVLAEKEFDSAFIKTNAGFIDNESHHGFFKLDMNVILHRHVTYTMELSSVGYTFDNSSYLGWIKEFENLTNTFTAETYTFHQNPFGYQLWGYK